MNDSSMQSAAQNTANQPDSASASKADYLVPWPLIDQAPELGWKLKLTLLDIFGEPPADETPPVLEKVPPAVADFSQLSEVKFLMRRGHSQKVLNQLKSFLAKHGKSMAEVALPRPARPKNSHWENAAKHFELAADKVKRNPSLKDMLMGFAYMSHGFDEIERAFRQHNYRDNQAITPCGSKQSTQASQQSCELCSGQTSEVPHERETGLEG